MYRLYQKNELGFSLLWIGAYVLSAGSADSLSASVGIQKIFTAPVCVLFTLLLLGFLKKHNLRQKYGLCPFRGNWKDYLYFAPLVLIISVNLWNGAAMEISLQEGALFVLSMVCVGIIEEIIFRGFLFKSLSRDNMTRAVVISSITFGLGHIINLLNGSQLLPTLLQICYAAATGFLFTVIFWKGKSLWPCIVTHSAVNSLSLFAREGTSLLWEVFTAGVLVVVPLSYGLWILKETGNPPKKGQAGFSKTKSR